MKAEVERTASAVIGEGGSEGIGEKVEDRGKGEKRREEGRGETGGHKREGKAEWVEVTVDIPGQRDDEPVVVFLGAMLHEALVAEGGLPRALYISARWHWKLYIDVCPPFFAPQFHPYTHPHKASARLHPSLTDGNRSSSSPPQQPTPSPSSA